jgi:hypothetical protein
MYHSHSIANLKKSIKIILIFLVSILFFSCNNDEEKIIKAIRKYKEDIYFKDNFNIKIHEIKVLEYRKSSNYNDSLINIALRVKLLETEFKLSGFNNYEDYLRSENRLFYIDLASQDSDYITYKNNLEKYRFNPFITNTFRVFYEVHVYEKFTISDINGNSKNILNENAYYLLDNEFNFIFRQNSMPFVFND